MSSFSIEKSYRLVPRELSIEYSAYESGLDRFVHPNKGQFLGRDALVAGREKGLNWNFVTMEVHGVTRCGFGYAGLGTDLFQGQAGGPRHQWRLWLAGEQIPGAWHGAGRNLQLWILNWKSKSSIKLFKASVIAESPYDADNLKLRA